MSTIVHRDVKPSKWQRFVTWLLFRRCERIGCGKLTRRTEGCSNAFRAGGLWLCPACVDLWHVELRESEKRHRVEKHLRDLEERREAELLMERKHGVYRGGADA